jgi:hypothetical protein
MLRRRHRRLVVAIRRRAYQSARLRCFRGGEIYMNVPSKRRLAVAMAAALVPSAHAWAQNEGL